MECKKLRIDHIETNCNQPTQFLTKCYCCNIITEDVCFLLKRPCLECREACHKIQINYNYCNENLKSNNQKNDSCYCCTKPLENDPYESTTIKTIFNNFEQLVTKKRL